MAALMVHGVWPESQMTETGLHRHFSHSSRHLERNNRSHRPPLQPFCKGKYHNRIRCRCVRSLNLPGVSNAATASFYAGSFNSAVQACRAPLKLIEYPEAHHYAQHAKKNDSQSVTCEHTAGAVKMRAQPDERHHTQCRPAPVQRG